MLWWCAWQVDLSMPNLAFDIYSTGLNTLIKQDTATLPLPWAM